MGCYITHNKGTYGYTTEPSEGDLCLFMDDAPWAMSRDMADAVAHTFVNMGLKGA